MYSRPSKDFHKATIRKGIKKKEKKKGESEVPQSEYYQIHFSGGAPMALRE